MKFNAINNGKKMVFGLYGAGGFAKEVAPIFVEQINKERWGATKEEFDFFIVESDPKTEEINGYKIISESHFFSLDCAERYFNIAIADSKKREEISNRLIAKGAKPISIWASQSVQYDNNEISQGAIICAFSVITSSARIGKFFHSNIYSYVAHDCVIGNYVTFAPNVHCNGNVHINDHAYIGTGAVIKQGLPTKPLVIGEGAVVGMGAVVTKDVAPYTTVVGNPAKPLVTSPQKTCG